MILVSLQPRFVPDLENCIMIWMGNCHFDGSMQKRRNSLANALGSRFFLHLHWLTPPPPNCRIYASVNRVSIGSDNGMSPIRHQAIIDSSVGLLPIGPFGTNFSEIWIETPIFIDKNAFENDFCEMAAILLRGDELSHRYRVTPQTLR